MTNLDLKLKPVWINATVEIIFAATVEIKSEDIQSRIQEYMNSASDSFLSNGNVQGKLFMYHNVIICQCSKLQTILLWFCILSLFCNNHFHHKCLTVSSFSSLPMNLIILLSSNCLCWFCTPFCLCLLLLNLLFQNATGSYFFII